MKNADYKKTPHCKKRRQCFFDGFYKNGFEDGSAKFQTWSDSVSNGTDGKIFFEGEKSGYIDAVQKVWRHLCFRTFSPTRTRRERTLNTT
ncbi:MAG: hypothetical protein L6V93_17835 [Clostridiales bacterium]|nr:MAG: hypothetical protein L6V93_17835 [Clostridiales bacterium]